jgi:hypothetical protein
MMSLLSSESSILNVVEGITIAGVVTLVLYIFYILNVFKKD